MSNQETREQDTLSNGLTSGQMVIMVCVALFLSALFFALGQLVARLDFSAQREAETEAVQTANAPAETGASAPQSSEKPAKTTVSRGPLEVYVLPATPADADNASAGPPAAAAPQGESATPKPPAPAVSAAPGSAEPTQSTSTGKMLVPPTRQASSPPPSPETVIQNTSGQRRISEIPPLPSPHRATPPAPPGASPPVQPADLKPVAPPPENSGAAVSSTPAGAPSAPSQGEQPPSPAPPASSSPAPSDNPPATASAAPDEKTDKKRLAEAGNTEKKADSGKFGIQIAAFTGSQADIKAEQFLKKVEKQLNLPLTIQKSADGKYYRVIITGYADRAAASAACAQIRKQTGLSEAFVRPIE